ncbi:hypothetical protein QR680_004094 [Steinernema hermaphroditum]|uniref:Uncharacterized protein n=1 Tax=Steinernema hermaphroditum TaxID=289476 RepID=A0AA39LTG6_9BILA|nr:hypothetical protein QR680_004094 [Steinernema hermaphroditum]
MNSPRSVSSGNSSPSSCSEASSSCSSPSCCDHAFASTSSTQSRSKELSVRARKPKRVHGGKRRSFTVKRRGHPRQALHKLAARKVKKASRSSYLDIEFEREILKEMKQVKALQAKTRALEEAGREMELQVGAFIDVRNSLKRTADFRSALWISG